MGEEESTRYSTSIVDKVDDEEVTDDDAGEVMAKHSLTYVGVFHNTKSVLTKMKNKLGVMI